MNTNKPTNDFDRESAESIRQLEECFGINSSGSVWEFFGMEPPAPPADPDPVDEELLQRFCYGKKLSRDETSRLNRNIASPEWKQKLDEISKKALENAGKSLISGDDVSEEEFDQPEPR